MIPTLHKGKRNWNPDRSHPPELAHLGVLEIEIEDHNGVHKFTPNDLIERLVKPDAANAFVESSKFISILSGKNGVLYRTSEAEVPLTIDEVYRLTMRDLTSDEFFSFCDKIGVIWELHDDFYDPDTGEALQPKGRRPTQAVILPPKA